MPAPVRALTLDTPVRSLPNLGDTNSKRLEKLGIRTVRDLLLNLPAGWESYAEVRSLADVRPAQQVKVEGTIGSIFSRRTPYARMGLTEARLEDGRGAKLKVVWFNQPYVAKQLKPGDRVVLAGLVRPSKVGGGLEMQNPKRERLDGDGSAPRRLRDLMPKYRLTQGLKMYRVIEWVDAVLPLADDLEEVLPEDVRARHDLLPIAEAVRKGHRPDNDAEWESARHRMAWQELFELQVAFALRRRRLTLERALPIPYRQEIGDRFKAGLGFQLTQAQRNAARDIFRDLAVETPMSRLLNGDVGSGKTAVAAAAAAMTHAADLQTVVMAPTEILARQHLHKFRSYLEPSFPGLTVELLVSGLSAPERRRVRTSAASGHCALLVGTHALIEDEVEFAALGLAVVDEQHRFGTRQREILRSKGAEQPHFLAMTATPIPRTLALARYGEMALSVIDELPPGRTPVRTSVVMPEQREKAYELVRREVRAGRQAFVICPLIEESETLEVRAATAEFERLRSQVFPDLRLSLVHGKLKEKDAVMAAFASGDTDVLVATSVVEVGVDVPRATVMMIEGAERFGLAQLHQFRGRVGRGSDKSYCLLLADEPSDKASRRLQLMETIHDGFRLAEEDMHLRGAGELLGTRQHGLTDEAMNLLLEPRLLDEVQAEAQRLLVSDPDLSNQPALRRSAERRLEAAALS